MHDGTNVLFAATLHVVGVHRISRDTLHWHKVNAIIAHKVAHRLFLRSTSNEGIELRPVLAFDYKGNLCQKARIELILLGGLLGSS